MREILFRGKRRDNEKWVEGYLMNENYINTPFNDDEACGRFDDPVEIDPSTVCQYIGSTDKNDRKIFEGDFVRRKMFEGYIVGQVVWFDIGFCGFYLKHKNSYYPMGKNEHTGSNNEDEVIGNIFDNTELIED